MKLILFFCVAVFAEVLDELRETYFNKESQISDKLVLVHYEGGYRGIFARADIKEGEQVVKATHEAMISSEDALKEFGVIYFLREAWANERGDHYSDNLILTLYLLLSERFNLTTYTRSLPKIDHYKLNFPAFWPEEILQLMPDTFQSETRKRKSSEAKLFNSLKSVWPASWEPLSEDEFSMAFYRMNTRIAGLGVNGRHIKSVLLPVFDLINHGQEKNVDLDAFLMRNGNLGYRVFALRDIKKGEELYVHYGALNDLKLLQKYGFTLNSTKDYSSSTPVVHVSSDNLETAIQTLALQKENVLEQQWPNYRNGSSDTKLKISMKNNQLVVVDELTSIVQSISTSLRSQMKLLTLALKNKLSQIKQSYNKEKLRTNSVKTSLWRRLWDNTKSIKSIFEDTLKKL